MIVRMFFVALASLGGRGLRKVMPWNHGKAHTGVPTVGDHHRTQCPAVDDGEHQRLGHRQQEKANDMTTVFTVKLGLTKITPAELVEKGRAHVTDCTGNANFTLPAGLLTGLTTDCDNLEKANGLVISNGGKSDTLLRNTRVLEVKARIKVLGAYVQAQSAGDQMKIVSAGFEVRKSAAPVGVLPAPQNLRAHAGKMPGEVDLRWNGLKRHLVYDTIWNIKDVQC